ncbi:hypothetical protein VPIG_00185 [Vibrio phage PWH3a-P1]|uniref:hypothetical protein n=1 Tax=Vibrio phage PWH3a-P1 TaxID=754058 RepID=UPI0002C04CD5|nr:hypothetical protein VPIG_00185 [Vibrio phage PWH3a-P1]AGH32041.1 hypothetical protein VPIG_00185 [Vibrio phage PWH3a-P1]
MNTQTTNIDTIKQYILLDSKRDGVHWGWWVFWGLVFYPVLLLTALIHFNSPMVYKVCLKHSDDRTETIWVNSDTYEQIKIKVGGF